MSEERLSIPVQEIAEACGVSHGKILLALRKRDLHETALEGNGRKATITSWSACDQILQEFLDTEEYDEALNSLLEVSPDENESQDTNGLYSASKLYIVGRGRDEDEAIAQDGHGYAFLESDDLADNCHAWISGLSEKAQDILGVSENGAANLPEAVPQLKFRPKPTEKGLTADKVVDAKPRWSRALISVREESDVNIPNYSGTVYLQTDEDLEPGPYIARIWSAIPTDVGERTQGSALIVEPQEHFSWDSPAADNVDAVRKDSEALESLLESTANRILSYINGEEESAVEPSVLGGIFETLSRQGEVFAQSISRIVVERLSEREVSAPPEAVQGLVQAEVLGREEDLATLTHLLFEGISVGLEKNLQARALDLETDGRDIWELGIASDRTEARTYNRSSIEEGIRHVKSYLQPKVWIGHNFREWDRDVIKKKNVEIVDEQIWDTLETEALLSPYKGSLALDTSHEAVKDAQVAYRLFCTQVIRVLLRLQEGVPLSKNEFLGPIAESSAVKRIRKVLAGTEEVHDQLRVYCEDRRDDLLSPSRQSDIVQATQEHLNELPSSTSVHILYPRPLEPLVEGIEDVWFEGREGPYQQQVRSPADVELSGDSYLARFAALYRSDCSEQNRPPVVGGLSPWLQSRLRQHPRWIAPFDDTDNSAENAEQKSPQAMPVEKYKECGLDPPEEIVAMAPELIPAYSTRRLAQYASNEFDNFISRNHLWARFDGAGSYCELTDDLLEDLGFEGPADRRNTTAWLHRTPQEKYVVHAHQSGLLEKIREKKPDSCEWTEVRIGEENIRPVSCVKVERGGANTSPLRQRLNPNTQQRAWYWTVQELLLREVAQAQKNRPTVLLVRGKEEVETLVAFFQRRNWFVPEGGTLRRRLERLESSLQSQRLLVVPLSRWTTLLTQDVATNLQLVVESLPIKKQQAIRRDEVRPEDLQDLPSQAEADSSQAHQSGADVAEEEDRVEIPDDDSTRSRPYAIQRGLYLVAPHLKWLSHTAKSLWESENLWVLDPRVEAIDLPNEVDLETYRVPAYDQDAFDYGLEEAERHFASPVQEDDLTIPDDWKDSLAHVFLPEQDGSPGEFYPHQEPYLEPIVRRESDVLVELPTGSGKSVLFQAPGLYHGLRHGLLTIVVTPLKALMVDQAYSLYDKGFLSSVEYVNGDLPYIEIRDIYRRLASGEISLLYVAPERFRSRSFVRAVRSRLRADGTLCYFVFDEAHTVSLWGLDFRPDFLRAVEFVNKWRKNPDISPFPCLMLSATITDQIHDHLDNVLEDYEAQSSR